MKLERGSPFPLGASVDAHGVNFAVASSGAEAIELCVFDAGGREARAPLPGRTDDVFHGRLEGARPGLVYGLRAHGPWAPANGLRFNAAKLLLDPYARDIVGRFEWRDEHAGEDARDNAAWALKARVVADEAFDPGPRPAVARAHTVLYEVHVAGFTRLHPGVPEALRGTFAGLASDAAIAHLKRLGVTTLELLPVQRRLDEQPLVARGLTNYWGYNTLGFFAVEPRLAAGGAPRDEFRAMVRRLHEAGLEVVLDVVFNHTAEGDERGPTLCWRGLDNAGSYRLREDDRARYENPSGCGNALDLRRPRVLQMVLDSLRHWVQQMGVDGFRFDLATTLAREGAGGGFDANAAFFRAVAQDPVLQGVKLIAEPWDVGDGGYRVGGFPRGWLEWNDRFRDVTRAFWLGHAATRGEFARRLSGSSDVFRPDWRAPHASVNFIAAHDGFTLRDLVSYAQRHNEANGEDNRDGHAHNLSNNCGVEGETGHRDVNARRARLQRALLACTLLAQGTPMLLAGDELGHSQRGNNNAYCQDNATSWIDWSRADADLLAYAAHLLALRRELRPLPDRWLDARALVWSDADGHPLTPAAWDDPAARAFAMHAIDSRVLLLVNAEAHERAFTLPRGRWRARLDSARWPEVAASAERYRVRAHGVALLQEVA